MPAGLRRFFGLTAPAQHGPPDSAPLATLPLLLLDTETTGLDPSRDRVVSLSAIAWRGHGPEGPALDTLVSPGRAIPATASAIHGIVDADLRDAAPYAEHHHALTQLMHGRVLLGHTIAFDLAVLVAEARRAGLHWPRPASLCLAELAAAVLPDMQMADLDQLARRLDVEIEGRHTARGDALAAGDLWARLLPHLGDRGIHHWGEARRAAAAARSMRSMKRRSAW